MATVQKGLRILVSALYVVALVLHVVSMIPSTVESGFPGGEWESWLALVLQIWLVILYLRSVRAVECRHRTLITLFLCGVLMYAVGSKMKEDLESSTAYFSCRSRPSTAACVIDRIWYLVIITGVFFSIVEVAYTLVKGPMRLDHPEVSPDSIITISPAEHPYGIQPNMIITPVEAQSQEFQQQPMYQPIIPDYMHSYPPMQVATATAPLTSTPDVISSEPLPQLSHSQRLSIFKNDDPHEDDSSQSPHPYSPRAYSQPLPIVTNIPPSGLLPRTSSSRARRHSISSSSSSPASGSSSHSIVQITTSNEHAPHLGTTGEWVSSSHDLGPPPPYDQAARNTP